MNDCLRVHHHQVYPYLISSQRLHNWSLLQQALRPFSTTWCHLLVTTRMFQNLRCSIISVSILIAYEYKELNYPLVLYHTYTNWHACIFCSSIIISFISWCCLFIIKNTQLLPPDVHIFDQLPLFFVQKTADWHTLFWTLRQWCPSNIHIESAVAISWITSHTSKIE